MKPMNLSWVFCLTTWFDAIRVFDLLSVYKGDETIHQGMHSFPSFQYS